MRQEFINKRNCDSLLLIFGGWGTWPRLFGSAPARPDEDTLLCYDYRTPDFDHGLLTGYRNIRLIAWSMGVWQAARTLEGHGYPWTGRTAVGGTLSPIDDHRGIPEAIFQGTLQNMSLPVLTKFRRRMCGPDLDRFMALEPDRAVEELKEELAAISIAVADYKQSHGRGEPQFTYDRAIIGRNDMIFPAANQLAAWEGRAQIIGTDGCHYDSRIFEKLISGELWG